MKVFIQQPVIPRYRVPLFNALAESPDLDLEVHYSKSVSGMPNSADESLYKFSYFSHECISKLRGSAYLQKKLELPVGYGQGDTLVYNSNPRFLSNRSLVKQARSQGCRIVSWNHANSSTSTGLKSWLRKKMTAGKADDLLLYTKAEVELMVKEGWQRDNLYFLNNTIDENIVLKNIISFSKENDINLAKSSKYVQKFKEEHGLLHKKVFLFCGRVTEKSELDLLIQALALCSDEERKDLLIVIIGGGEKLSDFKKLASSLNLTKRFLWLGAIYEERELTPWFLSASYFIYPGAIGLSVNHAMSYGLPVITHDNMLKQMPEFSYIKDGVNGFLYKYQNIESLKELIIDKSVKSTIQINDVCNTVYNDVSFKRMVSCFIDCLNKELAE